MVEIERQAKNKSPLILLTGCIDPSGMVFTKIQNPEVRKKQYSDSIKFYLKNTVCKILFVENSGFDISSRFQPEIENKRLEIITFNGNEYDRNLGKGVGEMLIIRHAIDHSSLIKECSAICKITGRHTVINITSLLNFYTTSERDLMVDLVRNFKYADSRLFIGCVSFYKDYLLKYADIVNDSKGFYFEHALCKAILDALLHDYSLIPFKYKPRYSGQSGTDGKKFNNSFIYWLPLNMFYRINHIFFNKYFY